MESITINIKTLRKDRILRNCANCNLCCKLPEINDLEYHKKSFTWCKSCNLEKKEIATFMKIDLFLAELLNVFIYKIKQI